MSEDEYFRLFMLIPTLKGGGAEKVFVNLANQFSKLSIKVTLIVFDCGVFYNEVDSSVNIKIINKKGKSVNALSRIYQTYKYLKYEVLTNKPTIVISTLTESNLINWFVNKIVNSDYKLVLRQAGLYKKSSDLKNVIYDLILKKAFKDADLIIANSPDTFDSIVKLCNVNLGKICFIGNPIYKKEVVELSVSHVNHEWINNKMNYIIAIGRLVSHKDFSTLIKAFKIVREKKDVKLLILGIGPEENHLKKLTESLGLTNFIDFLGFKENPYPYIKYADIFVLSSITEGFGNVLIEALSLGKPIVSTSCGGGPSYILDKGKYGDLVPVKNPNAMAEAIINRLSNLNEIDVNLLVGRAKEFSQEKIALNYLSEIKSII